MHEGRLRWFCRRCDGKGVQNSLLSQLVKQLKQHCQPTALRTRMQNPIHPDPINDSFEPNSIRVDICEIELTDLFEDTSHKAQEKMWCNQAQTLLPAAAARSDCTQGADGNAFGGSRRLQRQPTNLQEESGSKMEWCGLCDNISEYMQLHPTRSLLIFMAIASIIVTLSLNLTWITPKGHAGPTVIEGSCNSPTRCHVTAACNAVSPSSYTCSCPSWLVGSGFDDDPCICRSAVLRTPDFGRGKCVTSVSHFDMAGLHGFIFGMFLFLVVAIVAIPADFKSAFVLFSVWLMLVLAAADGSLTPTVHGLCGSSSFDAEVCGRGRFCVKNACSKCPYPDLQTWDDVLQKCIDGKAGNCTAHSCDSLPGSTCVPKQNLFVQYHVCVKSSGGIVNAPGATALAFAVSIAMFS